MHTVTIRYFANEDTAYWTLDDGSGYSRDVARYCANTYATFQDWRLGMRQVYGPARSPLNAGNMRKWFIREYRDNGGCPVKFSVRRVKSVDDLA